MKAVVLETRDGWAAVLREDGVVEKLRRRCEVGETIGLDAADGRVVRFRSRAVKWVAAAVAAVVLFTGGSYGYNNAYAYSCVTLDVTPSIAYVLNRRNRVLRVEAGNEDAEPIAAALEDAGVRRMTLTDAIDETTRLLYENDYLRADDDNSIMIDITSRGEAQEAALNAEVDAYFSALDDETVAVYVASGSVRESRNNTDPAEKTYRRIGGEPEGEGTTPPPNGAAPNGQPGGQPGEAPPDAAAPGSAQVDGAPSNVDPDEAADPAASPDGGGASSELPNTAGSGETAAAPAFGSPMRVSGEPVPPGGVMPLPGHTPESFFTPVEGIDPAAGMGIPLAGTADAADTAGTGVPPAGNGVPPVGIGVPPAGVGVPPVGVGAPPVGVGVPPAGVGVPPVGVGVPPFGFGGPAGAGGASGEPGR